MKSVMTAMAAFLAGAVLTVGSAQAESSWGAEDVLAAGGGTTIVGGGCAATTVQSGENVEVVYSGECFTAPVSDRRFVMSVYNRIFRTEASALRHCNQRDQVTGAYGWRGDFRGYVCQQINHTDGGGN